MVQSVTGRRKARRFDKKSYSEDKIARGFNLTDQSADDVDRCGKCNRWRTCLSLLSWGDVI